MRESRTALPLPPRKAPVAWAVGRSMLQDTLYLTPAGGFLGGLSFLTCSLNSSCKKALISSQLRSKKESLLSLSVSTTLQKLAELDDDLHAQSQWTF